MQHRLALLLCSLGLFVAGCLKSDTTPHFDGNYIITADLGHFPQSTLYIDVDASLSFAAYANRAQKWKLTGVDHKYFTVLASDLPNTALHVGDFGSPEVAQLPASPDERFYFYVAPAQNNTYTIRSVATGKYLNSPNCEKLLQGNWSTWSGDVNFTPDTTHCHAVDNTADTCYCVFSFHLVKQ